MSKEKNRNLSKELETDFFEIHQVIVYGCLRTLNISVNSPFYDDLIQIGLLALVEAYETFPKSLRNEETYYQFTGYAFQKVKWRMLDELDRTERMNKKEKSLDKIALDYLMRVKDPNDNETLTFLLLNSMMENLSTNEQDYLYETVINQLTVTEFARKKGVSRKTVYEWKKKIAQKLQNYKEVLRS